MSKDIPFDKEKFLNSCPCGCSKSRQAILDGIEKYRESDPQMVQYLEWYRDSLWRDQVKADKFRALTVERGNDQLEKDAVIALRAMADKIEEKGMHFMLGCDLPRLPIFSGDDPIESYSASISVSLVKGPLGG